MAKLPVKQLLLNANSHAKKGDIAAAQKIYQDILQDFPNNKRAQQGLLALSGAAPSFVPASPPHHTLERLVSQFNDGKFSAVIEKAMEVLRRYPDSFFVWNILGAAQSNQVGQMEQAAVAFKKVISLKPDHAEGFYNLATALNDLNRPDEALDAADKALALQPRYAEAFYVKGNAHKHQGQLSEAIASYRKAISLQPNYDDAHNNMGTALKEQGKLDEAIEAYKKALIINETAPDIYTNLATTYKALENFDQAVEYFEKAVSRQPDNVAAIKELAVFYLEIGKRVEGQRLLEQALKVNPESPRMMQALADIHGSQGEINKAVDLYLQALTLVPNDVSIHTAMMFCVQSQDIDKTINRMELAKRINDMVSPTKKYTHNTQTPKVDGGKINIGFVSADLHQHPVGFFIKPLMQSIDKSRFNVHVFSNSEKDTAETKVIRAAATEWHEITRISDERVAKLVNELEIDVLIDLHGYTLYHRLAVFAYRPAPVQMTWLGYFATTGLDEMDYVIGDSHTLPDHTRDDFTEEFARLPNSYLCFGEPEYDLPVSATPAVKNGFITFGCFNNVNKIKEDVIALWSRILKEVPDSKIYFKGSTYKGDKTLWIAAEFKKHDIEADRLMFAGGSPRPELLASYANVDIALDPFPYPGGTTTCEALWMGVPTVSKSGTVFVSQIAQTIAHNSGRPELCTGSNDEYLAAAVLLAGDIEKLKNDREERRDKLKETFLFNGDLFSRDFEQLMSQVVEKASSKAA